MSDRHVAITWEFKINGECHPSYPATLVDMLLTNHCDALSCERIDSDILSWRVTDIRKYAWGKEVELGETDG